MPKLPADVDITALKGYHTIDPIAEASSPKGELEEFKGRQIVSGRTPPQVQEDVKGFVGLYTQRPDSPAGKAIQSLRQGGFTDEEVTDWSHQKRKQLSEAGFGEGEIDTYFGQPPFDPAPVKAHINETIKAATQPSIADGKPKPVNDFMDALKAGFGESVTGLLMGKPTTTVSPDAPRTSRIAGQVGTLAGDVPAMMGGYLAGGANPVTGMAGAFALPAGMRKILMDKYEKGEAQSFPEFWDRFSGAFIDTAKGWITGAATGAVGKAIGMAPIVSPTAKAAATMTGEVATMVTVGKALEGQVPGPNDFIDTALALGFVKGSIKVAQKLRNIYAETGVKPDDVAADVMKDPTLLHELRSENVAIPKVYREAMPVDSAHEHATVDIQSLKEKNWFQFRMPEAGTSKPSVTKGPIVLDAEGNVIDGNHRLREAIVRGDTQIDVLRPLGGAPSVKDLHAQADKSGMVWDDNPIFMDLTEAVTGKRHLDELSPVERGRMSSAIEEWAPTFAMGGGAPGRAPKGLAAPPENIPIGQAQKAVLDRVVQKEPATARYTFSDLYTSIVDNLNPIKQALRKGGKGDLPTAENPYSLERLTRGTMGKAHEFIKHGAFDFDSYKTVTKGYEQILEPVKKDLDGFRAYMVAKRAIEKAGQGVETGVSLQEARVVVQEGKGKYQKIHEERIAYRESLLDYLQKSGILNQKKVAAMREANKDYVPFYRLFEEDGGKGTGVKAVRDPIKKMEGSSRQILDPIVSDIKDTFLFVALAEKNAARQAFVKLGPEFAEKVGVRHMQAEVDDVIQMKPAAFRGEKNEMVVFEKGERMVYTVEPKVAEAFNGLDSVSTGFVAQMIHAPASLLRAGVTITPDFIARNVMRDAVSSFIYAGSNPIKTALGMKSIITKDTAFHNWMKGGGAQATMVAIDRDYIKSNLVDLNEQTGIMRRAWNVAKTPLDILRATSELIENSTRLGAVRSELMKSQDKAKIQALSLIAREATVDFGRHGKDTGEFAKSTAFFNPAVQGIDRFAREMKQYPVATTTKALAAVTLPSLLLWWVNKEDKEIENLPRWQKDLFWVTRAPLPDGGSFILRIPKPQEFGIVFGTIPERLLDAYVKDNPTAMKDIENSLLQSFTPSMIPTSVAPIISQFANRDTFQGHALIPTGQEGLLPEYQYTEYTTETAKAMGSLIGQFPGMEKAAVSSDEPFIGGVARALTTPILLENYLRSWTGGMGMYLFQLADKGLREAGAVPDPVKPTATLADLPIIKAFVVRYPSASAQSIQDFYTASSESKKYFDTIMHLAKEGNPKSITLMEKHGEDMAQLTEIRGALTQQSQIIRMIHKNPQITPDEKRQLIDTLYWRMIDLSHAGNEGLRNLKESVK